MNLGRLYQMPILHFLVKYYLLNEWIELGNIWSLPLPTVFDIKGHIPAVW